MAIRLGLGEVDRRRSADRQRPGRRSPRGLSPTRSTGPSDRTPPADDSCGSSRDENGAATSQRAPLLAKLASRAGARRVHLNRRDVTLICFSRAPIDRLIAYKKRMGWQFPYVSTYQTEFPFDFGLALTSEQAQEIPEVKAMIDNPPGWLEDWGRQIGAKLEDGLREGPSFIAFARENGTVYHTYTVMASDPFVAPYHSFLLKRTPKPEPEEARAWRKDEYPD